MKISPAIIPFSKAYSILSKILPNRIFPIRSGILEKAAAQRLCIGLNIFTGKSEGGSFPIPTVETPVFGEFSGTMATGYWHIVGFLTQPSPAGMERSEIPVQV
nr:hypothetical protein [Desulfobacula sp.]